MAVKLRMSVDNFGGVMHSETVVKLRVSGSETTNWQKTPGAKNGSN